MERHSSLYIYIYIFPGKIELKRKENEEIIDEELLTSPRWVCFQRDGCNNCYEEGCFKYCYGRMLGASILRFMIGEESTVGQSWEVWLSY